MLLDHILTNELSALYSALVDDDLVVFAQLYLVIFDGLAKGFVLVASLLDVVDNLEEVDGDGEDLSAGLQHLLVLLDLCLVLPLELQLVLGLVVGTLQHGLQLGLALAAPLARALSNPTCTLLLISS